MNSLSYLRFGLISLFFFLFVHLNAQDTLWHLQDVSEKGNPGVSLDKAMQFVKEKNKSSKTIIVAIIDSGVDTAHVDIIDNIWSNPKEIPGNGIDDDGNGYIDDVHGWNFIGGKDGKNVDGDTWEMTRLYVKYSKKYADKKKSEIAKSDKEEYKYWLDIKTKYEKEFNDAKKEYNFMRKIKNNFTDVEETLTDEIDKKDFDTSDVKNINSSSQKVLNAKKYYLLLASVGLTKKVIDDQLEYYKSLVEIKLNKEYQTRQIVGDDELNMNDSIYGNNNVKAGTSSHGTHVAGIVGSIKGNGFGGEGIADNVKIMVVRVVPGGDEHDKDVAMGIRYAVKMGAQIINCSFGKSYSPNKKFVEDAIKYAEANNVLIVHAAGNDNSNNDKGGNFPTNSYSDGVTKSSTWLEVGASNHDNGKNLAASFSNYGHTTVDVFAPGVDIYSLAPDNEYASNSGTSMAAPVAAGVAALVWSYNPQLTAAQLKDILMKSAVYYGNQKVIIPGEHKKKTKFKKLCVSGGVVNAYEAMKMADRIINSR